MAASNRKKTPKRRRWILPKLLMLLGIVVLSGILVVIFIMEQELNRIGFFGKSKRLPLQPPQALQQETPAAPPSLSAPPSTSLPSQTPPPSPSASVATPAPETSRPLPHVTGQSALSPTTSEGSSAENRKRLEGLTSSQSPEKLSQDDRKRLEDVLRSR